MTLSKIKTKITKWTTSHFLVLVGGKSHCYPLCFSVKGSCASAHTLACEPVVPVKWVRVPQEGRFVYLRAVCQHLWKRYNVLYWRVTHSRSHTRDPTANQQQKWDLNSSLGDSRMRFPHHSEVQEGPWGLYGGLSTGLQSEMGLNSACTTYCLHDFGYILYCLLLWFIKWR